jgi:gliding motility-associated lipoprotein GldH
VNKSYELILGLRHLYGFQLNSINVTLKSVSPLGKETAKDYEFKIKDSNDKYIGSCGGELCDLETVVDEDMKFAEAGAYKFVITHNVQADRIPGVMDLGLIIDEKDK